MAYNNIELGKVRLKDNPNVHTEDLIISKTEDKKGNVKVDLRVYLDTIVPNKFQGMTKSGFRLDRDQWEEFKKLIPVIDNAFPDEEE